MKQDSPTTQLPRRGLGLLELLMVMTVSAVLLTVVVTALNRVLIATGDASKATHSGLTTRRLSRIFRSDCHEARVAEVSNNALRLSDLHAGEITYELKKTAIVRTWQSNGTTGRDAFRLPSLDDATVITEGNKIVLTLRLRSRKKRTVDSPPNVIVIKSYLDAYGRQRDQLEGAIP